MRFKALIATTIGIALLPAPTTTAQSSQRRPLTFEERVRAQEAIERVYYSHQLGARRAFEAAVPKSLLEKKVRAYLEQSLELERMGAVHITADALRGEWERILRETFMPQRLEELQAALGHDPSLIQECLVLPVLAERAWEQIDDDEQVKEEPRQNAESLHRIQASDVLEAQDEHPLGSLETAQIGDAALGVVAPATTSVCNVWVESVLNTPGPLSARTEHTAVWTGNVMIVWGGGAKNTGSRFDPVLNTWTPTTLSGAPSSRGRHTAIWTGDHMVIWGGISPSPATLLNTGGLYDPVNDTWIPMSTIGAPPARAGHKAVWTGNLMIVSEGSGNCHGGRYDPQLDVWLPMSVTGEPCGGLDASFVWTGTEVIVWRFADRFGAKYDPVADAWTAMSNINAPTGANAGAQAAWAAGRMVVVGGYIDSSPCGLPYQIYCRHYWGSGGRYDPATDTWSSISLSLQRESFSVVSTGDSLIIWGGHWCGGDCFVWDLLDSLSDGYFYFPATDQGVPIPPTNVPMARGEHTAVLTDDSMLVWGGMECQGPGCLLLSDGGRFVTVPGLDGDGDGYGQNCDCDETRSSVFPGAPQICGDGLNNDCRHSTWPSLAGTNETDDDADSLTECLGDCNDAAAWVYPGAPQLCDGWNNDCLDPAWPTVSTQEYNKDFDGFRVCQGDCDDTRGLVYPGAPQYCGDLRNNDCLDPGWPSLIGTNESDDDGDLKTECMGDCDDANPAVWGRASEVTELSLRDDDRTLDWTDVEFPGSDTFSYDTLRSGTANDFVGSAVCVESDDGRDTRAVDRDVPSAGGVFYYLVRARNGCPGILAFGSAGKHSNGVEIPGRACP